MEIKTKHEKYANYTHKITLMVKIIEKNITINHFDRDNIDILVGNTDTSPILDINLVSSNDDELIYRISISNLASNGNLNIYFL